jgi:hypothetical protein
VRDLKLLLSGADKLRSEEQGFMEHVCIRRHLTTHLTEVNVLVESSDPYSSITYESG